MPSGLDVALHPLFHGSDVFLRVLEILAHIAGLAARDEAILRWASWLCVDGPATVLDSRGDMVWPAVSLGVL